MLSQVLCCDIKDLLEQVQRTDLFILAEQVVERLSPAAKQVGIDLRLQGSPCLIDGVPQMLEEILVNLCDNAIKYNRENGSVTVAITPRESDVLLAVTDTEYLNDSFVGTKVIPNKLPEPDWGFPL